MGDRYYGGRTEGVGGGLSGEFERCEAFWEWVFDTLALVIKTCYLLGSVLELNYEYRPRVYLGLLVPKFSASLATSTWRLKDVTLLLESWLWHGNCFSVSYLTSMKWALGVEILHAWPGF